MKELIEQLKLVVEALNLIQHKVCSQCTTGERARPAITCLDGNDLCSVCFMKAKPRLGDYRELERQAVVEENKQIQKLKKITKRIRLPGQDNF